jgi:hypothetical protein
MAENKRLKKLLKTSRAQVYTLCFDMFSVAAYKNYDNSQADDHLFAVCMQATPGRYSTHCLFLHAVLLVLCLLHCTGQ